MSISQYVKQWRRADYIFAGFGFIIFLALSCIDFQWTAREQSGLFGFIFLAWGISGRLWGIKELKAAHVKFEEKAMIDAVTGALSKNRIVEAMEREMKASLRKRSSLSVVMIEASNILEINRQFDRLEGDASLAAVAWGAQKCLRDTDYLGRIGGLTFCALLPETKEAEAAVVVHRIRDTLNGILRSHAKGEVRIGSRLICKTWNGKDSLSDFLAQAEHELLQPPAP